MRWLSALIVLGVAQGGLARAECRLAGAPWLESHGRRSADARLGEPIDVFVVAPGRLDGHAVLFSDDGARGRVPFSRCREVEVRWRRVEPRRVHTATPAPNQDIAVYANAVVFGAQHGKWIGFDTIEYFVTELGAGSPMLRVTDAAPTEPDARTGDEAKLGVMRLAAVVRVDGDERATSTDAERAFRYTFRRGDGFLGWLSSFYNVPYLFGSAGKGARAQAERYLGADCADVLVAALRRAGRRDLAYTSVTGLVDRLVRTAPPVMIDRLPSSLRFGREVRPGDLLALDYLGADDALPGAWDHIVAVVEDRGPDGAADGVLGPEDLVADSGDAAGLKLAPLSEQGAVRVQVLRARGVPVL